MSGAERVRALHARQERYHDGNGWLVPTDTPAKVNGPRDGQRTVCAHCLTRWPCPTIRALDTDQ